MNSGSIIEAATTLLSKTAVYEAEQHDYIIRKMFDLSSHIDMEIKIELLATQARIYCRERGMTAYEHRTDSAEDVIYCIIYEILKSAALTMTYGKFMDEKGFMLYSDEVRSYENGIMEDAFRAVGGVYELWFKAGRASMRM